MFLWCFLKRSQRYLELFGILGKEPDILSRGFKGPPLRMPNYHLLRRVSKGFKLQEGLILQLARSWRRGVAFVVFF